jgi:putative membrane protein
VGFLIRVLVNAVALWITTRIVTELSFGPDDDLAGIIQVAIVFGLVNAFIRPVLKLLTFPLSLLTFGLFGLLVNGLLLLIVAALSNAFGVTFSVGGYPPDLSLGAVWWAIVGSIVLSIVSTLLSMVPLPGDR